MYDNRFINLRTSSANQHIVSLSWLPVQPVQIVHSIGWLVHMILEPILMHSGNSMLSPNTKRQHQHNPLSFSGIHPS